YPTRSSSDLEVPRLPNGPCHDPTSGIGRPIAVEVPGVSGVQNHAVLSHVGEVRRGASVEADYRALVDPKRPSVLDGAAGDVRLDVRDRKLIVDEERDVAVCDVPARLAHREVDG